MKTYVYFIEKNSKYNYPKIKYYTENPLYVEHGKAWGLTGQIKNATPLEKIFDVFLTVSEIKQEFIRNFPNGVYFLEIESKK